MRKLQRTQHPSPRQGDVLRIFLERAAAGEASPTFREIGDALGIRSTNAVADHVKALTRKGYLRRSAGNGTARGYTTTRPGRSSLALMMEVDLRAILRDAEEIAVRLGRADLALSAAAIDDLSGRALSRAVLVRTGEIVDALRKEDT